MPATAERFGLQLFPVDDRKTPDKSARAAASYLRYLHKEFGEWALALAAYNAGAGAVARSSGVPHYAETQNYVRRITSLYYGGFDFGPAAPSREPVRVKRDSRGVLYISNTD